MSVTGKKIKDVYPNAIFAENLNGNKLYINKDNNILTDSNDIIIEVIEFSLENDNPVEEHGDFDFIED